MISLESDANRRRLFFSQRGCVQKRYAAVEQKLTTGDIFGMPEAGCAHGTAKLMSPKRNEMAISPRCEWLLHSAQNMSFVA